MSRYIGNYLRVPSLEPQQASAPGIWSLSDQLAYQRANLWPPARDPYYNQTVLHLSGDVAGTRETNPATQPRTFLSDASSNNFLLTPNGDVSARPFSPYASSYSNYFDGSGDYLSRTSISGSSLIMGTDNFTAEVWVYPTTAAQGGGGSSYGAIFTVGDSTTAGWGIEVLAGTNTVNFRVDTATAYPFGASGTSPYPINTWYHLALVRNSGTLTFFVNGLIVNTGTFSTNLSTGADLYIGVPIWNPSVRYFQGYISNLRIIKGQCLFTGNFTPGIAPLTISSVGTSGTNVATAITGTVGLLTCHANRFIDGSANNFTLARTGDVAVAQNSPFVEYDTTSGSGYFDGTAPADYLTAAGNSAFDLGSGDFTIEAWIYTQGSGSRRFIDYANGTATNSNFSFLMLVTSGNVVNGGVVIGGTVYSVTGTTTITNAWTHVALVRNGTASGNLKLYVNGVAEGTAASLGSTAINTLTGTPYLSISSYYNGVGEFFNGYISSARIIKGTAVYTGNFTPPTGPLARSGAASAASYPSTTNVSTSFAESATSLLTLQTRAPANNQGILDTSPNSFVVTRNGNVAQGSFSPFSASGWSVYTGGTGNYITAASSANFAIGTTGTVEGWYYWTVENELTSNNTLNKRLWSVTNNLSNLDAYLSNRNVYMHGGMGVNTTSANLQVNTWYHIAAVYNSGTIKIFVNGVQQTLAGTTTGYNITGSGAFGINTLPGQSPYEATGYASNVRVVKGTALYISNFTPSTNPLTYVDGTVLLTCQSPNFIDNGPNRLTITPTGSPKIQPFSPFAPTQAYVASQLGGSAYFDGNGDYLTCLASKQFEVAADITIEFWVYLLSLGTGGSTPAFFGWGNLTSKTFAYIYNDGRIGIGIQGTNEITSVAGQATINSWMHLAFVRNGSTTTIYKNGVNIASNTTAVWYGSTGTDSFQISGSINNCYISDFRFVKSAIYTGTFTPPTAPLINIPGTSLLLNFTGAGIVDSTGKNVVETVDNNAVQTKVIQYGTGSMYFDGSGDYLKIQPGTFKFGTSNFTVETWLYPTTSMAGEGDIIGFNFNSNLSSFASFRLIVANSQLKYVIGTSGTSWAHTVTTGSIPVNTWTHLAFVRNGSTFTPYINGIAGTTATNSSALYEGTAGSLVGAVLVNPVSSFFNGYMKEIRVTIGLARYSGSNTSAANFIPPTGPFPLA